MQSPPFLRHLVPPRSNINTLLKNVILFQLAHELNSVTIKSDNSMSLTSENFYSIVGCNQECHPNTAVKESWKKCTIMFLAKCCLHRHKLYRSTYHFPFPFYHRWWCRYFVSYKMVVKVIHKLFFRTKFYVLLTIIWLRLFRLDLLKYLSLNFIHV